MIGYEQYTRIKDKYCLCYFGYSDEYLVLLKYLKPKLEQYFPGLEVYLGCKDDKTHLLQDCGHLLTISQIKVERRSYGYIRELRFNGRTHPIEDLLVECGEIVHIKGFNRTLSNSPRLSNRCVIITKGAYPTEPLSDTEIERLKNLAQEQNYEVVIDDDITNASLVMGVESVGLFQAAANHVTTKLMPTGLGTRLYKLLFPNGKVLHR